MGEPRLRRAGATVGTVAIVGLGPVGLTTAVAFASQGHRVIGFDIDENRRAEVTPGKPPFYEKGLEAGLQKGPRPKRFSVFDRIDYAGRRSRSIVLCVRDPSEPGRRRDV